LIGRPSDTGRASKVGGPTVSSTYRVAHVGAGAIFEKWKLVEPPEESGGDPPATPSWSTPNHALGELTQYLAAVVLCVDELEVIDACAAGPAAPRRAPQAPGNRVQEVPDQDRRRGS
jgi:hypothetical protein